MTFDMLMAEIAKTSIRLQRRGDELIVLGDHEVLTSSLMIELRSHKSKLLEFIDGQTIASSDPVPAITPEMLPLVTLTQEEIDGIVNRVPGGVANVQDIYPLAPLQEGILFHHLMTQRGDPYLLIGQFSFDNRSRLDGYLTALQAVVDRHDILRTAIIWEGLPEPVQVVWRKAMLQIEVVDLDPTSGDKAQQMYACLDPRQHRIDLSQAPLLRIYIAYDEGNDRWLMTRLLHHLIGDHSTLEVMQREIKAHLLGQQKQLPEPLPFRNLVAQTKLGISQEEHESFFREMLGDIDEPTAPFGLLDILGDGTGIKESRLRLDSDLARRLRASARQLGVSAASLFHLGWAQVLARVSGRDDVVFGTVLFGRMQVETDSDGVMGLFINTLPIRLHIGEGSVEASVRHTHAQLIDLMLHEHASLALAQRCSKVPAPSPLFSALLNFRHSSEATKISSAGIEQGWEGIQWIRGEERTSYPFTLSVDDLGQGFILTAQTQASVEAMRVCEFMHTALASLAEALESAPQTPVRMLEVLPASERHQVLYEWNDTKAAYPSDRCIHELFEEQVSRDSDAVAVIFEDQKLSYGELNRQANQLAHYLRELGVGPDTRVAICVERGFEMVVALLAVLKAGGAYVPLDPAYPTERLHFMLDDSSPIALLTQNHLRNLFPQLSAALPVLSLDTASPQWQDQPETNPALTAIGLKPHHLAYIIYTSGSTGTPKGVMVEHGNLARLFSATQGGFEFGESDVWALVHSYAFDFSVWEIWGALIYGGRLLIVSQDTTRSPEEFYELLCRHEVTILNQTPSAFRQLIAVQGESERLHSLRYVIFGGEALEVSSLKSWYEQNSEQQTRLINMYGITETTVHVTYLPLEQIDTRTQGGSPIGCPLPDLKIYILDVHGEPVPVGVAGELYIGGAGVARGYLNRPELTAEKFLVDPFSPAPDARMYRTGDLGRWLADGNIEFLGRNDFQVKIRGFRIELGEIEARLAEYPAVREAVVLAREDTPGDQRLVAYYTSSEEEGSLSVDLLRSHLSASLPEYMVPAAYVQLVSLPLTSNGKLDRRALPAPDSDAYATHDYVPPQGETETILAAIWADLLKIDRVGRHDNFFELGGHSLLTVQVITRLRQVLGVEAAIRDLFVYPVLADFARSLSSAIHAELPSIAPANRGEHLPLSFAQQRLWFLAQMEGVSGAYHVPGGVRLRGALDVATLRRALDRILTRHEALRTTFVLVEGEPAQRIGSEENSHFQLLEHDLRQHVDAQDELGRLADQEARTSFDLETGPLVRGRLIRLADNEHALLITLHHIVSDGWSMGVLVNELSVLYGAFLYGEADPLPELAIQYADYAMWQRQWIEGDILQRQTDYWKTTLTGAPALLELPADHSRPVQQDYVGAFAELVLDEKLTAGLKDLSRRHNATLYMTLLAAWGVLLARLSGQQDIVIGSPAANRNRMEIEGLIGFFVNTLALRLDLSGSQTVDELLQQVKQRALDAQTHQDIPFEQIVEVMRPVRSLAHSPLFQAVFAWQNTPQSVLSLPGLELIPLGSSSYRVAKFDLTLTLQDKGQTIAGEVEYATSLFEAATIERWLGYFRTLLQALVEADASQTIDQLSLLSASERHQVLYEWNDTKAAYPSDRCIHELFEEQVSRDSDAVAVIFEDQKLSYGELNRQANQLAHYLRELGVGPDTRVAICVERGFEMVVALLAVLKAGGAYVPLDPAYPTERLHFMLDDSSPIALLTQNHLRNLFPQLSAALPVLSLDTASPQWQDQPETNPALTAIGLKPHHLAYIIYTSGSTGTPKGVMVEHGGLSNYVNWALKAYRVEEGDGAPVNTSLAFDATITSLYLPLLVGKQVTLLPGHEVIESLQELLLDHSRFSLIKITPSHLKLLNQLLPYECHANCANVFVIGGEPMHFDVLRLWQQQISETRLINEYGPTETVVGCCVYDVPRNIEALYATIPIGRPIANTQIYILDVHGEPVPVGVAGELYIGGAGVARGYLNRPELTAEKFLVDPFSPDPDARMYRTGDLGRWLADGNIEFLGRNDFQVKIRGFRIELGEIEARLAEYPAVREAVVLAREDTPGDQRLVAYYTSSEEEEFLSVDLLRSHLSASLPEYMVPAAYVQLVSLPLTSNGKLDRRALPAPDSDAYATHDYVPPQGETETILAAIWADLLKIDRVGRHDNFFTLGGHSLLAVRVTTRLRQVLGVESAIRDLFVYPVLADFARSLSSAIHAELPSIAPANRGEHLPLSFAQQRLWFLAQMEGVSGAYHVPGGVRLRGALDVATLRRALDRILTRHEALRTTFVLVEGEPAQRIGSEENSHFQLLEHDLRQHVDAQDELGRLADQEARTSFDLETGPLVRGRLIRLADNEHALLITLHHIVSDGWSMGVLVNELSVLYGAFLYGEADPLPELAIQYADYAMWQRQWIEGDILQRQTDYWKTTLTGAPALLELPADHSRPVQQDYVGAFAELVLDEKLTAGLKDLSRRHNATLYMTLLAAWGVLLARLSGQQDIVIGSPAANRNRMEIEGLIGFFVNTLALRLDLSGSQTVDELLQQVKQRALDAQTHQDIPFEQIVEVMRPVRSLAHSPLFQAVFAWQNTPQSVLSLPGLELIPLGSSSYRVAKFDLTLTLQDKGQTIAGGVEYATSLFEAATIERWLGYFRTLLQALVEADASQTIDQLSLLSASERHQVLYEWNDTKAAYPSDRCIHELFEEQVSRDSDAVAVIFEDQKLSYGELNRQANQLAHYLRELGVGPDTRVAICVERGFEMVVALLAVLKAGGAYVPLDPAYPTERLHFMLDDSSPIALLTQNHLRNLFPQLSAALPVLSLDTASPQWQDQPETNPALTAIGLKPHHLAYIIYTSGSTGTPKGVMVEHGGLSNYVNWALKAYRVEEGDGAPVNTSLAFDATITSLYLPLLVGKQVTLLPGHEVIESLQELLLDHSRFSLIKITPSHLKLLNQLLPYECHANCANVFVIGGEPMHFDVLRLWQQQISETRLINEYGPTETVVGCCVYDVPRNIEALYATIPIGRPIANTQIYILDVHGEPVPVGVAGELYIGGAGVARGYLNRPELTAEKFLVDPFSPDPDARMYRTGDLGRWLADGNIEFLGRNDFQVKIRGFRIELGEIEARLAEYPAVREAVVLAREDTPGDQRLVAYYTSSEEEEFLSVDLLRSHLSASLPEYMVPAAYVQLVSLPLTSNGKLDRRALPAPDSDAYATHDYVPPQGETETILAAIWADLLKIDRVGRHDNFFELGGHSLLAITLIERLRRVGLQIDVRAIFATPTVAGLAAAGPQESLVDVPPNQIFPGCEVITPEMLPLVKLTAEEIERIVASVPGGAANVQDIYPLAPLQEGLLFHHLIGGEGDPYLLVGQFSFDTRARLEEYLNALQLVIERHDILRTAILWEGLPEPVQVVLRKATLRIEEVQLDPVVDDVSQHLHALFNPRQHRIDIREAPLLRVYIANDRKNRRWLMLQHQHHLMGDHTTMEVIQSEIQAHRFGHADRLSSPLPFRNLVAQARLGVSQQEHEVFFRKMLGDVEEPTAPFGLLDVQGDGTGIKEAHLRLDAALAQRLRSNAKRLGVSMASLCHLAWANVLAKTSGRRDVVFGTVLFGRMQGGDGSDRVMGPFINTLPIRISIGEEGVEASVRTMHALLAGLMRHEHASLALAQRCSAVPAPAPLFSALLNYRHSSMAAQTLSVVEPEAMKGIRALSTEERTSYPFTLSVDDLGQGFILTAQTQASVEAMRVCEFMHTALASLAEALESAPQTPVRMLEVLPASERHQVLYEWNDTKAAYPSDRCIHELFEEQVSRDSDAVAVIFEDQKLSYGELNRQANQLAHYLRELGVGPDTRVAICVERGFEMVVALLAVLKAGGAYVPLDPAYPTERLHFMLDDSSPIALLTQNHLRNLFPQLSAALPVLSLDTASPQWQDQPKTNPALTAIGLKPHHLAYIIYTSGSTGTPKGVMVEHGGVVNRLIWMQYAYELDCDDDAVLQKTPFSFDVSVWELFWPLLFGAKLVMARRDEHTSPNYLIETIRKNEITIVHFVPSMLQVFLEQADETTCSALSHVVCSGEALPATLARRWQQQFPNTLLHNLYGPTEATVDATAWTCPSDIAEFSIPIGRPIANTQIYILDVHGEPVPVGVAGELYIGGAGVARGYLNRPELTAEKFLVDPFSPDPDARMYRTGDLGRWLADGNIEFLGRNDFQVKIRGFRIELGEIEARLAEYPAVREAVVLAREDTPGDQRLVAYYTSSEEEEFLSVDLLRSHLSASLPEYMVPAAYVQLVSLPLTSNGKLDRRALPAPDSDAYATHDYVPPQGETETILAAIWADLLKIDRVGRHDDFFTLGGHSLLAVRVITRLRQVLGVEAAIRDLFVYPVLADFAEHLINVQFEQVNSKDLADLLRFMQYPQNETP